MQQLNSASFGHIYELKVSFNIQQQGVTNISGWKCIITLFSTEFVDTFNFTIQNEPQSEVWKRTIKLRQVTSMMERCEQSFFRLIENVSHSILRFSLCLCSLAHNPGIINICRMMSLYRIISSKLIHWLKCCCWCLHFLLFSFVLCVVISWFSK